MIQNRLLPREQHTVPKLMKLSRMTAARIFEPVIILPERS